MLYGSLTEVLLEVRRWGYRVLLEVSTESPPVQSVKHGLSTFKLVLLQVRELQLQELVELRPYQQLMSVSLPLRIRAPRPRRLVPEQMREPQPLGLALGVHVLVCDALDALEWPQLGTSCNVGVRTSRGCW